MELGLEQFEAEEFERYRLALYTALVCEAIPRRLGKGGDRAALAKDKKLARRVANLYRVLWAAVDDDPPSWYGRGDRKLLADDAPVAARKLAATIDWQEWLVDRMGLVAERRRVAAGIALREGRSRWGVVRLRLLDTEADNLARIRSVSWDPSS